MVLNPITAEVAYNLRFERGLALPKHREYSSPRLKEIAERQHELLTEMQQLDAEIITLAQKA